MSETNNTYKLNSTKKLVLDELVVEFESRLTNKRKLKYNFSEGADFYLGQESELEHVLDFLKEKRQELAQAYDNR